MKTVMVLGTMTSPSGAPIAALRLAGGLRARGWRTSAAFLYAREPMNRVDHEYSTLLDQSPRSPIDHLRIAWRLARMIRRERPDAIFTFLPLASVLGLAVARLCGVKVRIVSHRVPRNTYTPTMLRLDTLMARSGTYTDVVAVSGSVAASCAAYPAGLRNWMVVIYNGLKDWVPSPLTRSQARARFGLPDEATLLVAVGRLDPQKNYPLLLDALSRTRTPAVLAAAGEGALRDAILDEARRRGLGDRVVLLGALPRDDIPHLLAAADLFVQPSLFEGQSNALLEALQAGLPAFVSDVPEQVETVRSDDGAVAGAILPLGDGAAWAVAIDEWQRDSAVAESARFTAAVQARRFSFERMIADFEGLLGRIAGRAALSDRG